MVHFNAQIHGKPSVRLGTISKYTKCLTCCNVIRITSKELVQRSWRERKLLHSTFNVENGEKVKLEITQNRIRLNPIPLRIKTHLDEMTLIFNLC